MFASSVKMNNVKKEVKKKENNIQWHRKNIEKNIRNIIEN